ncbi:ATP-binding protein [Streptomyces sp. WI04-05B]|uniref:ATP-binding protein n=1 Tax=Streptomyces TaxID=1883 RepID=UPI0029A96B3E|nr:MULTISPECIES: LuxR C-terminal-related transcriptional regulator [unclassified Streptomyces]MDX2545164.1 LuxR C-terminal-related transcriptional regulator [Streptomyces sp. WI04-05B]MDX2587278.1 LuxR C-terminal-related transcriptional regulator [Streptomyces sp. WI04-05A]
MISEAGNLPVAFTSFVGRRHLIAEIRRVLGPARLLTLTGMGGVGKTRLAVEAAAASRKAFADGVWLIDLAPVLEPSAVADATAAGLGVPDLGARPVLDQITGYLAGRRALIVMDNCEHLIDACAELAETLLSAAPELRILATSRQTLGLAGEHVLIVPPLSLPEEAVELLRDRATAIRPEFRITDLNRAEASRLCADLDGLPLAIELAASRLRTLTVDQTVDRLQDRFSLLTSGSRTARPRQRTLRALIDWSYELCGPAERLLWNRLSVFAGGFTLDAAEDVCAGEGIDRREVVDLLDRLVGQSIVLATEQEGLPRYRLLETIRHYGRQRLAESGEEQRLLRGHRDFFLALAEHGADNWFGPGQQETLARLRADHSNLLAALDQGGDPQAELALAAALRFHWCTNGFLGEGRRRLEGALAAAPEPTPARAKALWAAGWVALLQGDLGAADQWLSEADELGEQLDDRAVRANVLGLRGSLALFRRRPEEAVPLFEGAVAAQTALGEEAATVFWLFQLANAQAHLGDPRSAETARHAVAVAQAHGEGLNRTYALYVLGLDAWVRGDLAAATELACAGLEIQRGFNDHLGAALLLELLAWISAARDDHDRAGRLLGTVRTLWRDLGTELFVFGPDLAEHHARCEEAVVRALGPAGYEKALTEGSRLDGAGRGLAFALSVGAGPAAPAAAPSPLTRRERQVAALVAQGMTNRQIAAALVLSPRTVGGHVDHIMAKLGYGRRAQIATWWAANQVPDPSE